MDKIQKIRQEIERRMNRHWEGLPDADSPEDDWTHNELCELGAYKELEHIEDFLNSLQQEQPEVNLEEFTEKMDAWKARFNHPDDIPIKATMAFTARMFYMYPNVARQWYEQLPKATMG